MALYFNHPLRDYTTIKIGGVSKCFFLPKTVKELVETVPKLVQDYPLHFLGGGSNTIFGNFKGCVVYLGNLRGFKLLKETDRYVELEILAGTPLRELTKPSIEKSWSGLEGLFGIPRITLGGAVAMNASAYGFEVGNLVREIKFLDLKTFEVKRDRTPLFGYRTSEFPQKGLIISAILRLEKTDRNVRETIKMLNLKRRRNQPLNLPTAGSTFKNPEGFYAGKLLQEVGLKGFCTEKGLCFSNKHANFLVNLLKKAELGDVLKLLDLAKERVYTAFGILLEEEVKIVETF